MGRFVPVMQDPDVYDGYYNEFGARFAWPLLHGLFQSEHFTYRPELSTARDHNTEVQRAITSAVTSAAGSVRTPVIFHDYQFLAAPALLRGWSGPVGFFLHTPWVRTSPRDDPAGEVRSLLTGVLGADLIWFQSRRWAEEFLRTCEDLCSVQVHHRSGRIRHAWGTTWVRVLPVPLGARRLTRLAHADTTRQWQASLRHQVAGRRVICRVDRADPAKNLIRGFEAFEALLDQHPDLRSDVCFLACLVPSRTSVPEYARYLDQVQAVLDRTATKYPGSVMVHFGQDAHRAVAALTLYDVLLVNAVNDGMNLVAREGALLNAQAGVLVLSDRTGSADLLQRHCVRLRDPSDVGQTVSALYRALRMPEQEREHRAAGLAAATDIYSPGEWLTRQLTDLRRLAEGQEPESFWPPDA
nr:trehalose-6-phosphate synthase [Kineosporia babensis]